jgi:hypothetical protein
MSTTTVSFLTIKVPEDKCEEQRLIALLRWLETPNAKQVLPEQQRITRRKMATEEFRRSLIKKEMFRKCLLDRDEIYN